MSALPGTTGRRRVYLMRHGHVDYFSEEVQASGNISEVPLTELGRSQAQAAGSALNHIKFDRVICSGLPRTLETTRLAVDGQAQSHPDIEIIDDLREIGTGTPLEVSSKEQLAALMVYYFEQAKEPGATFMEGGERFDEAYARSVSAMEALLGEPNWHTALVVAHEGINRLLLGWATGNGLNAIQSFEQDLACINILDFDMVPLEGGAIGTEIERTIIKAVNITPYNFTKHGMNLTSLETLFSDL